MINETCWFSISTVNLHQLSYPSPVIASTIDQIKAQYPPLSISLYFDSEAQWVVITGSVSTWTPLPGRPVPNPHIVLRFPFGQGNNTYTFEVNSIDIHTGPIGDSDFHARLNTMLPSSSYYLCPGIGNGAECSATSRAKSIRKWGFPFNRVDHKNCELWLPMPALSKKWGHSPTCVKCTALFSYLRKETRRKAAITPNRKRNRLSPSSNSVSRLSSYPYQSHETYDTKTKKGAENE